MGCNLPHVLAWTPTSEDVEGAGAPRGPLASGPAEGLVLYLHLGEQALPRREATAFSFVLVTRRQQDDERPNFRLNTHGTLYICVERWGEQAPTHSRFIGLDEH